MEITIPIEIHVWSDRDGTKEFLETNVHANIIQESEYPRNNSTDIWQVRLNNNFYGLNNKIDYNFISWINNLSSHISVTCVTKARDNELIFVQFSINFTGKNMEGAMIFLQVFNSLRRCK